MNGADDVIPHLEHRRDLREFILAKAEPWHRTALGKLYDSWEVYNERHFGGELEVPYITFGSPTFPSALGQCCTVSSFGGRLEIVIRKSLIRGTHPAVNSGAEFEAGRLKYVEDVLLHEMVHQWQIEVAKKFEASYHGHGPVFCRKVNEIGEQLGLPPVRTKHKRRGQEHLPQCQSWPHAVRDPDFYLGALHPRTPVPSGPVEELRRAIALAATIPQIVAKVREAVPEGFDWTAVASEIDGMSTPRLRALVWAATVHEAELVAAAK